MTEDQLPYDAGSSPSAGSIAMRYHRATKYAPDTIGNHPGLDWEQQPLAIKQYHGDEAVELADFLPLDPNPFTGRAPVDLGPWQGRSLAALSQWIFFTYGVTAVVPQPDRQLLLRAAPSAGGLYPAELYIVVRDWPGIAPGLYGYDPRRHRLMLLAEGPETAHALTEAAYGNAAISTAPVIAAISGVFERSRWRYQERAYRRILLDSGHVIGNAGLVAHAVGLQVHATAAFCDDRADATLRLDQDEEGVLALLALGLPGPMARPSWTVLPSARSDIGQAPVLDVLHRASRLPPNRPQLLARGEAATQALETTYGWAAGDRLRGTGSAGPVPLASDVLGYVLRRRSCRRFAHGAISRDALARILAAAYLPEQVGLGEQPAFDRARLATFISVTDVTGIAPGMYYLAPHQLELRQVRLGDLRDANRFIALGQELCGDAGAVIFHAADLVLAVREMGDRAYRHLHLDAGILGQRLNMAALAEGLGASGIGGFFDDHTADLLGIPHEQAVVYITTIGIPA